MSIIRNRKALLITLVVLLVGSLLAFVWFLNIRNFENAQNEALNELIERIGEYDERSIVLYGTSKAKAENLAERFGAELRITSNGRFATLTLPEGTTIRDIFADKENRRYIGDMSADYQVYTSELEEVENYVSEKLVERPYAEVTDEGYVLQSYLDYLNIQNVWEFNRGSGVTVAVIDTGIDTDHPEFAGVISEYSYNATEDKIVKDYVLQNGEYDWSLIEDEQGHGTAVAGVIAAPMNNGGIVGIASEAEIIVIKAECDELGRFKRTSDLVFGLYYAIERDVDVVNMSFGTSENVFEEAAQLAYDSDIICIAAAGNDATTMLTYPAADKNVIGIGALASNSWELANYSNYGENTNLVAPGTTYTAKMGGGYGNMTGTSFASPVVAGAVALYMQNNSYMTFDDVTEALYISTYDLGDLGKDWYFGFGALDIYSLIYGNRGTITYDMLTDELDNLEGTFIRGHALQELPEPERLYAVFDGWYYDDTFTQEYSYYTDKFYGDITLYAKWVNEDDGVPYTYVELDDGTIEIRSYTGKRKYITVPDTIDGKPVSSIGDFAFKNKNKLREVVLPDTVNHIGISAFAGCTNLVTIYIPANVTEIETEAFRGNVRLSTVAFKGSSKLTAIGDLAFAYCSSLREFEVPSEVNYLNGSAFYGASSLRSIKVQKGNVDFASVDGVLFNYSKNTLVAFPAAKSNTYALPDGVTVIGDYAFAYCKLEEVDLNKVESLGVYSFAISALRKLDIPDTVCYAGKAAFYACSYLSDVTIGKGLTVLSQEMFMYNTRLEEIVIPNTVFGIDMKAFSKSALKKVIFEENSVLTEIGGCVFSECQIEKIDIPASVVAIGNAAFEYNPLTSVTFGENSQLWGIGYKAFSKCMLLESITLPDRLGYIGDLAFELSGLKSITVPAGVTQLGYGAFAGCDIAAIEIEEGNTVYYDTDGVVYTKDDLVLHSYPSGKTDSGYTVKNGVEIIAPYAFAYSTVYFPVLPESLTQISEYAFYNAGAGEIRIPDNVLQIGRYAFAYTENLQTVQFTENAKLPRISYQSFAYSSLYYFTVPSNVSTIAQGAFEGAKNLSQITFAKNSKLESISAYMFDGCERLNSIVFEEGSALTSVQAHALEGMSYLFSIDFGNAKLENVDNFAFRFCTNLQNVSFPDTVVNIGRYAFYGCEALSQLSLPENVEHIGSYAFLGTNNIELYFASETLPLYLDENWDKEVKGYYTGVTNVITQGDYKYAVLSSGNIAVIEYIGNETEIDLTKLDLGGKITIIGGGAFKDSSVRSVVLPGTLTSIQAEAFAYSALESVVIPQNVTFIGREAFAHTEISALVFDGVSKINFIEQYAFTGTKNLKTVTLPASLTAMGTGVFMQSGLTSVNFENGISLTEIPRSAFAETRLTSVSLPDSVVLVNHNAFNNVQTLESVSFGNNDGIRLMSNAFYHTGLKTLHIPANVTYIGEYCFVALSNLTEFTVDASNPNYTAVDGLLLSGSGRKLISVPAGRSGILTVPLSVEEIGFGAFEESKLTQVLFHKDANILSLGYRAFFKSAITEITVPKSVVAIDYYAFAYCDNLTTVVFEEGSNLKGIYEGAFCGDGNLENIIVPDSIVEISDFAFYGCSRIKDIPVENNEQLKGIFSYAFAYTGISGELVIPESVIDIGAYAFRGTDITKLTVPDTNKMDLLIGIGAFRECNKLEEVTLPFIGASYEDVFESWLGYIFGAGKGAANKTYVPQSIKKVTVTEGITTLGPNAFYQLDSLEEINVPSSVSVVAVNAFTETVAKYELKNTITFIDYDWMGNVYYLDWLYSDSLGKGISGTLKIDEGVKTVYFSDVEYLEEIILPKTVKEFSVNKLDGLKAVDLFEGLETASIYNCQSITEVELPSSVKAFDFTWCTSLKSVTLPKELTEIPGGAFAECYSLESIDIPESVMKIGDSAFSNCWALKSINIPSGVTEIGSFAFYNCSRLPTIVIPEGVIEIDEMTFANCYALSDVTLPKGLKKIGAYAFQSTAISELVIPDGVTYIGGNAFGWCDNLYKITLPSKLEQIGTNAFEVCGDLREIVNNSDFSLEFGSSENGGIALCAQKITEKDGTVRYLDGIEKIETIVTSDGFKFEKKNGAYTLRAYVGTQSTITLPESINGEKYAVYKFIGGENVIIPAAVEVGNSAFADNKTIVTVAFEEGNREIGSFAFSQCSSLEKVVLPEGMEILGSAIFNACESLTEVVIPDTVLEIRGSFWLCEKLETITLPDSLLRISGEAFYKLGLKEIYIPENVFEISGNAFTGTHLEKIEISPKNNNFITKDEIVYDKNITTVVYVPDGITNIVIPKSVTSLGGAFRGKTDLKTVRFESGSALKTIQYMDFAECSGLESVVLPTGIERIEHAAFLADNMLKNINIPDTVTYIDDMAFEGCDSLEAIHIPASVEYIGDSAFHGCTKLDLTVDTNSKNFRFENGVLYSADVTKIIWVSHTQAAEIIVPATVVFGNTSPFGHNNFITRVVLPEGMTEINTGMFNSCTNLKEVVIPSTVTKIGDYAFAGCYGLESIVLPEGVEEIGEGAFSNCCNFRSIDIPSSVRKIGRYAFSGCGLSYVELPEGIETLEDSAFAYNYKLCKIIVPSTVKYISDTAFYNYDVLVEIVNNSDLDINFTNSGSSAKTIVDKNGNRIYKEGITDCEVIIKNGLLFVKEDGKYTLRSYIGTEDTVALPLKINGCDYAIYLFDGAKNVILPSGWKKIDESAFSYSRTTYDRSMLESIVIPDSVTEIGWSAFSDCVNLKSVVIPNSVEYIGGYAFFNCSSLTEIVVPESVVQMENNVFEGCTNLKKVVYGSNIEWLWADTLKDTAYYNNPENWENGCLYVGTNLIKVDPDAEFVELNKNTTTIAEGAFEGCFSIKQLSTPYFRYGTFAQATNIETLILTGYNELTNLEGAFGNVIPVTLKHIVLTSDFQFRTGDYTWLLQGVSGVTIFVEKDEENLRWDANFPGWSNGNRVIYGDDWTWLEFRNGDGEIISRQPRLVNQVIIRPYINAPEPNGDIAYKFVGWDVDGDGIADNIPATSTVDISARAIFAETERKHTVSFVDTDGKVISSSVLDYGTVITAPAAPQKRGHTFMGWSGFEVGMIADEDVVFTAQWKHDGNGHVWSAPSVIAPTCTEKGYTVTTCGICDMQIVSDVTSPVGHSWGSVVETVNPSCETEGSGYHVCNTCGEKENVVIEANGHAFKRVEETASTCETHGKVVHKCSECGKTVETQKDLASHSYVKQEIDKNTADTLRKNVSGIFILQENGNYACYKCSECEKFMLANEDTFSSSASVQSGCRHANLSEWKELIPATCVSFGIDVRYCLDCDTATEVRIGAAAGSGHAWGDWVVITDPTCIAEGEGEHTCTVCGHSEKEKISKLPHTYTAVVTKPTCTEGGYTTHTCSCGDSYVDAYLDAIGHSLGEWYTTVSPTESVQGEKRRDCSECDHFETAVLEVLDHDHYRWDPIVLEAKNPTCTVPGLTEGSKCSKCGEILTPQNEIPATGHTFGEWYTSKSPTCTAKGEERRDCDDCDHFETRELEIVDHTYTAVVTKPTCAEGGYTTHKCVCGDSYVDTHTEATGHSFTHYVSDGNATLEADGTKTAVCDNGCGKKDTVTDEGSKLEFNDITSDIFEVKDNFISGISVKTTVKELKESVNETGYVRVVKDGKVVEDNTSLATGMKIQLMNGTEVLKEVTVVVTGDTNGDGNISVTDMISVKAHILKKSTLTDAYGEAGDTNGDGSISITDFIQIKAHILGKSSLEKKSVKTVDTVKYNAAPAQEPAPKKETAKTESVYNVYTADFLVPARFVFFAGTETIKRSF